MENKKNKRKLFKRIGAIVGAVVVAIVAFSLPFLGGFSPKINSKNMVASADENTVIYNYSGSSWLTLGIHDNTKFTFINSRIEFQTYNDSSSVQFYAKQFVTDEDSIATLGTCNYAATGYWNDGTYYPVSLAVDLHTEVELTGNVANMWLRLARLPAGMEEKAIVCRLTRDAGFTGLVSYIYIGVETIADSYSQFGQIFERLIVVSYYDENDKCLSYAFPTATSYADDFTSRYYYVSNNTSNEYRDGYAKGHSVGFSEGEISGYSDGHKAGEIVGYNNGYSAGANAANKYTFFSLVSAVIDAPIQAFMGLFNFELLGINLAGFFTGLLTLAFIITIVRLIMP